MRLVPEDNFSPIAIVLESRKEAETFWKIMREVDCPDAQERKFVIKICKMFSKEAKL